MMRTLCLLLTAATFAAGARASTFVGNGGNSADVEWLVTVKQIEASVALIEATTPEDDALCTCNGTFANSSTCDALNALSATQRKFCGRTLKAQLSQLAPLVRDTNTVRVSWTTDTIDVLEDGQRRAVDAVTDPLRGTVTLNADRFRSLSPSERVFLISHELMHLTRLDGKRLTDEGAQGPFTAKDGSRQLINSMAGALTVNAETAGAFERYSPVLKRPQGWKLNWIELSYAFGSGRTTGTYNVRDFAGGAVRYTRFFNAVGANVEFARLEGDRTVLGSATAHDTAQTLRVGVTYRLFPFADPLTAIGQSNLWLSADLDFVNGELKLHDPFNDETMNANRVGVSAQIKYVYPIAAGVWAMIAESYASLPGPYSFANVSIENDKNIFETSLGASYAF